MNNSDNIMILTGTIIFDPKDVTRKHKSQASWKCVAMVSFEPKIKIISEGICGYYAWFINKRYNLTLNPPLRGAHVTFINDRESDVTGGWNEIKNNYHGKKIEIVLNLEPRSDGQHWWLRVPHGLNSEVLDIRTKLGLNSPYFNLHMTIGHANNRNIEHSEYILNCINKGFIQ